VKSAKATRVIAEVVTEEIVEVTAPPPIVVEDDDVPEVPGPDMHEDIAEQKALIEKLKEERAERTNQEENEGDMDASDDKKAVVKRTLEEAEAPLTFEFREAEEAEESKEDRVVRSNRRMSMPHLQPQQKSAAWGVAMFALGFAAVATLPSFIF